MNDDPTQGADGSAALPAGEFAAVLEEAHRDDRLVIAPVEAFFSLAGVPLPAGADPVVALHDLPIGRRTKIGPKFSHPPPPPPDPAGPPSFPVPRPAFEGAEHDFLGDHIQLTLADGSQERAGEERLALPNGEEESHEEVHRAAPDLRRHRAAARRRRDGGCEEEGPRDHPRATRCGAFRELLRKRAHRPRRSA